MPEEHVPYYIASQTRQETYNHNDYESLPCYKTLQCIQTQGAVGEMAAIKEGGVTQNESLLPKFLHKKRWLTTTIFLRYML